MFLYSFRDAKQTGCKQVAVPANGKCDALWDFLGHAALHTREENDSDGRMTYEDMTLKPETMH